MRHSLGYFCYLRLWLRLALWHYLRFLGCLRSLLSLSNHFSGLVGWLFYSS